MKSIVILITMLLAFAFCACGTEEYEPGIEYIVVSRIPKPPDQKHFHAIEIHSGLETPVLAIKETTGRTYLPTMSSYPECNKKVIQGFISADTIFVTNKILRDTSIATVGQ